MLKLILSDGTVITPVIDKDGNYVFTYKQANETVVLFKLKPDEVLRIESALTQSA